MMNSVFNMAPNNLAPTGVLFENDPDVQHKVPPLEVEKPREGVVKVVWRNVILFAYLHVASLYAIYLIFTSANILTTILNVMILHHLGGLGVTAGAHRLWSHRSYKATFPLKVLLVFLQTMAFQNSVIDWAKDHRVHHKFSDTDADPHNANRGFFFSHIGWVLSRKHPEVKNKGSKIDISDLQSEPILRFQHKYYLPLLFLCWFVFPVAVPMYFWGETFKNATYLNFLRFALTLHVSWLINSVGHMWGYRSYDKNLNASNSVIMSMFAIGEGWHNYHHTFPWDFRPSELGNKHFNLTLGFITLMAKIGWAYDLKTVPEELIKKRVERTGDGSHEIWGWGDKDQPKEDCQEAIITYRKNDWRWKVAA